MTIATEFSTREVPWMKHGRLLEHPTTAAEAARLAGLDFTVQTRPAGWLDEATNEWHLVPHRTAVVRDDTREAFEFVGSAYPTLQYAEAFDFMDAIEPEYVAGGSLRGGRQGYLVVRAPGVLRQRLDPLGDDPHELFVVLRTSHDRTRSVEVAVMPLRSRCMNQLTLRSFLKGVPHRWAISHDRTMRAKLAEAQRSILNLGEYADAFKKLARRLDRIEPTEPDARAILDRVFDGRERTVDEVLELWLKDDVRVGHNGTGWGLVNAVSEYQDWHRRGGSTTDESRFRNALDGITHQRINRAASYVLAA